MATDYYSAIKGEIYTYFALTAALCMECLASSFDITLYHMWATNACYKNGLDALFMQACACMKC